MRKIKGIILTVFFIFFSLYDTVYPIDEKEEAKEYLAKVNIVLIEVQLTSRSLSQKLLLLERAIQMMQGYIDELNSLEPPETMVKQHKMVILAFKKMKMGFYVLTHGDRDLSIRLLRSGRDLLRIAADEIVEYSKEQGLIPEK